MRMYEVQLKKSLAQGCSSGGLYYIKLQYNVLTKSPQWRQLSIILPWSLLIVATAYQVSNVTLWVFCFNHDQTVIFWCLFLQTVSITWPDGAWFDQVTEVCSVRFPACLITRWILQVTLSLSCWQTENHTVSSQST